MMATVVFFFSSDPISLREVPDIISLQTKPGGKSHRRRGHAERTDKNRDRAKVTQKVEQSQNNKRMHAKIVTQHAFHLHSGDAREGDVVNDRGAKVKTDAPGPFAALAKRHEKFAQRNQAEESPSHRTGQLTRAGGVV